MLVLTRRSKDKIHFPQLAVTIHFIRVQSGQVKVGVDAPREIKILRDEIVDPNAIECAPASIEPSPERRASRDQERAASSQCWAASLQRADGSISGWMKLLKSSTRYKTHLDGWTNRKR